MLGRAAKALALGALATGAGAIGALAVGRLAVGKAVFGQVSIDELRVRRLVVDEIEVPAEATLEVELGHNGQTEGNGNGSLGELIAEDEEGDGSR